MDGLSVTDPSDFPKDAPGLREIDAALRCTICLEFFDAPTTTACGHCFCSMCIRNFLSTSDEEVCPKCRKGASEHQLRPNPALEDAVVAWRAARSVITQLYKDNESLKAENERVRLSKKRRIERETPPASSSKTKRKASSSLSEDEVMVVESSEVEELTLDSLVTCPSCAKKIKHGFINKHLDSGCKFMPDTKLRSKPKSKGKETEKDSWSKIFGGSRHKGPQSSGHKNKLTEDTEPLPTPTYATMKDKQIKDLLLTYDLLVTGDRTELITRHEQWVRLYNANLDRSPKLRHTLQELRVELKKLEVPQSRRVSKPTVDDAVAHQIKYRGEFAKLIEQARPRKKVGIEDPPPNSSPPLASPDPSYLSSDCNNQGMTLDS